MQKEVDVDIWAQKLSRLHRFLREKLKVTLFYPYNQAFIDQAGIIHARCLERDFSKDKLNMLDDTLALELLMLLKGEQSSLSSEPRREKLQEVATEMPQEENLQKELDLRVGAFLRYVEGLKERDRQKMQYRDEEKLEITSQTEQWIKIFTKIFAGSKVISSSIFCFIAAKDGYTRELGQFKIGDIFKPAGVKKPAKNARGNVFLEDFGNPVDDRGSIIYLK